MRYTKYYIGYSLLILSILSTACSNNKNRYALRDSVITAYLNMQDTSGQYDTSETDHKVLKAYIANDTSFFKQLQTSVKKQATKRANWDLWNADIPLTKLQDLGADEAYRFVYSLMGTPFYEAVTVTKTGDSIKLHYFSFSKDYFPDIPTKSIQYTKRLLKNDWDELENKLSSGDFWRLKKGNSGRGVDGFDLTVIGYKKGEPTNGIPARYNFVHRFMLSTLNDAFFLVYDKMIDQKNKWF